VWIRETSALVAPGQLLTGRKQLSQETGIPEGTVEKILRYLETEQQIEPQTTAKFRVITIKNWGLYPATPDVEQQNNNNVTAEEQQRNSRGTHTRRIRKKRMKRRRKQSSSVSCFRNGFDGARAIPSGPRSAVARVGLDGRTAIVQTDLPVLTPGTGPCGVAGLR